MPPKIHVPGVPIRTSDAGASLSSSFVVARIRAVAAAILRQRRTVLLDQALSARNQITPLAASRVSPGLDW